MSNVLIELDKHDKEMIEDLCNKCVCGQRITLENYIDTENLLGLVEELQQHIESLEKDKEVLAHQLYHPEDYDERADIYYEERRMEN